LKIEAKQINGGIYPQGRQAAFNSLTKINMKTGICRSVALFLVSLDYNAITI